MKTHLRQNMILAFVALAACSENKLEVGNGNDAGVPGTDGAILCEYQGRMVGVDEVFPAKDNCNTCSCNPTTRQMACTLRVCYQDGGVASSNADGAMQCEYQGTMVAAGESVPAKDGCNTCTCDASSRQFICTRNACNMGGSGGSTTNSNSGTGGGGGNVGTAGAGGTDGGAGGATACPFVAAPKPISMGTVLGVGKSSTGTIYMIDQVDSLQRVFISDASGALVRQRVLGSGSSQDFMVFTTNGPDAIVTVQIDTPAGQAKRMGVYQGVLVDRKTLVIGQDGEELKMLAASDIAKAMLRNLPGTVTTEYVASTADGNFIVVTRPTDDAAYADFRLFYGPTTEISERKVGNVLRALDGGSTKIDFTLNGETASAYFQVVFADGGFAPGPATLTLGSQTTTLTRLSAPPANAKYLCAVH